MCVGGGGVVFTVPARGQGEGISQRPTGEEKGRAGLNEIFMWLFSLFILFILFSVPEPVDAANPSTHPRNTILMMHAILITQTGFHKEERSEMCFDISEGHYEECVKEIQGCSVR